MLKLAPGVEVATQCSDASHIYNVEALYAHLSASVGGQLFKLGLSVALRTDSLELHRTIVAHHRHSVYIICTGDR